MRGMTTCEACRQEQAEDTRDIQGIELKLCERCKHLPEGHVITLNIVNSDHGGR